MKVFSKPLTLLAALSLAPVASAVEIVGVEFPYGPISFADNVVFYDNTLVASPYNNPVRTLGAAQENCGESFFWCATSLGNYGTLIVEFTDNALTTSGDGRDDLFIFEVGDGNEAVDVFVAQEYNGSDESVWVYVGKIEYPANGINIDEFVNNPSGNSIVANAEYKFVKIVDIGSEFIDNSHPGADINAIGAMTTNPVSIQDRPGYRPSTDIYLAPTSETPGCVDDYCGVGFELRGHTMNSGEFQFNVEYEGTIGTGVEVDKLNDSNGGRTNKFNWGDANHYAFQFSPNGTAEVRENQNANGGFDYTVIDRAHWTITGWSHTPFYGTWSDIDNDDALSDGDYLKITWRGYHYFPSFGVNKIMLPWYTRHVNTEVEGYFYRDETATGGNHWLQVDIAVDYKPPSEAPPGSAVEAPSCTYNPNAGFDLLLLLLLISGTFHFTIGLRESLREA